MDEKIYPKEADSASDRSKTEPIESEKYKLICTYCDKKYSERSLFCAHFRLEHPKLKIIYSCSQCYEVDDNFDCFENHRCRFECNRCGKIFSQQRLLISHTSALCGKPFACKKCKKDFFTFAGLRNHIHSHHSEIKFIFTCKECGKIFNSTNGLTKHLKEHSLGHQIVCDICNKRFTQKVNLKIHMQRFHDEKKFTCESCDKSFSTPAALESHSIVHSNYEKYKCNICNKFFKTEIYMKRHLLRHKATGTFTKYACEVCKKEFETSSKLKQHRYTHTGEKPYECRYCQLKFTNIPNRIKHIKRMHTKPKISPVKDTPNLEEKIFLCKYCEMPFFTPADLESHLESHLKFICEICDKLFRTVRSLKEHRLLHNDAKTFSRNVCIICDKQFPSPSKLKQHIFTHTGEKTYECRFCMKKFTTQLNRLKHVNRMHNERPVKMVTCKICKKVFESEEILKEHYSCHGTTKLFSKQCNVVFPNASKLNAHMNVHIDKGAQIQKQKGISLDYFSEENTVENDKRTKIVKNDKATIDVLSISDFEFIENSLFRTDNVYTSSNITDADILEQELQLSDSYVREQMMDYQLYNLFDQNQKSHNVESSTIKYSMDEPIQPSICAINEDQTTSISTTSQYFVNENYNYIQKDYEMTNPYLNDSTHENVLIIHNGVHLQKYCNLLAINEM